MTECGYYAGSVDSVVHLASKFYFVKSIDLFTRPASIVEKDLPLCLLQLCSFFKKAGLMVLHLAVCFCGQFISFVDDLLRPSIVG